MLVYFFWDQPTLSCQWRACDSKRGEVRAPDIGCAPRLSTRVSRSGHSIPPGADSLSRSSERSHSSPPSLLARTNHIELRWRPVRSEEALEGGRADAWWGGEGQESGEFDHA